VPGALGGGSFSLSGLFPVQLATASTVDSIVFAVGAFLILVGAIGVVISRNPVHAALMLVMTLLGVAVLFVEQQANFLAAVQVIVYAGAIVVLFLFVIMFLGVDRRENLGDEPLPAQRPLALILVALGLAGLFFLGIVAHWSVGAHSVVGEARGQVGGDTAALGRSVFTTYLFPFEVTSALLVIAVVGAVVLARRPPRSFEAPGAEPDEAGGAEGEPPAGQKIGDPMTALAEAVANAIAAGLVPSDTEPVGARDEAQEGSEGETSTNTRPVEGAGR
jgi:NADH-quinone oxidoreductase subunit J